MAYKQYSYWGKQKLLLDRIEPTHFVRNALVFCEAKKLIKKDSLKKIGEIGCGFGILSKKIASLGVNVDAFDLDKKAIRLAKAYNADNNIQYDAKDIFSLNTKKKYDCLLMIEVLEHIKDDQKALKKINQLLRTKGFLLITVPAHEKYRTPFDDRAGHVRRYTREQLNQKLEKANFEVLKSKYFGFPLLYYYYFHVYLRAAENRDSIRKKKISVMTRIATWFIDRLFLLDLWFPSSRGINLLIIARKR